MHARRKVEEVKINIGQNKQALAKEVVEIETRFLKEITKNLINCNDPKKKNKAQCRLLTKINTYTYCREKDYGRGDSLKGVRGHF